MNVVHSISCFAVSAALVFTAAPASAAPADDDVDATQVMNEASAAFNAGDYDKAAELFETAFAASGDPNLLFNIGRVHEQAGRLAEARDYYRRFILEPGVSLENRSLASERAEAIEEILGTFEDDEDDTKVAAEPEPPPPQVVQPSADDRVADSDAPKGRPLVVAGAVFAASGVVSAVVGGVLLGLRRRDIDRVETAPNAEKRRELESSAQQHATVGISTLVAGVALVGIGVPLLAVGVKRNKRSRVSVSATPRNVTFAVRF